MQELIKKIEQWAIDRGIDNKGTIEGQSIKTAEEIAELIKGISKDNIELIKDSIGDVFVTLVIGNMLNDEEEKINLDQIFHSNGEYLTTIPSKTESISYLALNIVDIVRNGYNEGDVGWILLNTMFVAKMYNLEFKNCVESAYSEIANRKGRMIDGTFVKEGDY